MRNRMSLCSSLQYSLLYVFSMPSTFLFPFHFHESISMKLHAVNEGPLGKTQQLRRKTPKIAPLIALTLIFAIIPIYYPYFRYSTSQILFSHPEEENDDRPIQPTRPVADPLYRSQNHLQQNPEPSTTNIDNPNLENPIEEEEGKEKDIQEPKPQIIEKSEEKEEETPKSDEIPKSAKRPQGKRRGKRREKKVSKRRRRGHHEDDDTAKKNGHEEYVHDMLDKKYGHEEEDLFLKKNDHEDMDFTKNNLEGDGKCDLFNGEWVENEEGPYYTNTTCWAIQEHQNCMKFGRPDRGFLKWKWKPYGCELPIFDPLMFLELMRGKTLTFVGDSVARNHMQSLICLLSRVTYPIDASKTRDENFKRWEYRDYDFNISIFWSPYLVKTERTDPNDITRPFNLYLDEFDETWTSQIENFDYVIISAGHWFFRPSMFYANRHLIGCLYCSDSDVIHRPSSFSYRRAFRTAFNAINSLNNFKGVVFLRSFAPSHFEGGPWDKGGDCVRKRPFRSNEVVLDDYNLEMYNIQMQELRIGERSGRRKGVKFRLMDMTRAMLMRPDGHPSKYGHWPVKNVTMANDCVHWCLPGPIDAWNDFLLEMIRRE